MTATDSCKFSAETLQNTLVYNLRAKSSQTKTLIQDNDFNDKSMEVSSVHISVLNVLVEAGELPHVKRVGCIMA